MACVPTHQQEFGLTSQETQDIFDNFAIETPIYSAYTVQVIIISHRLCYWYWLLIILSAVEQLRHEAKRNSCLFFTQGSKPTQHEICELSMLEQLLSPPTSQCQCIREKLCELSSGIATGSSGVTPREPNSWQHIADFLKRRQRHPG